LAWGEAETALRGCQHHLNQLLRVWKPTLSINVYNRAMGSIVNTVLFLFLRPVLEAEAISEAACTFVASLFRNAQMQCAALFSEKGVNSTALARDYCNLWGRFSAAGDFMNMSLADIKNAFANERFVYFSNKELSSLVIAVFDGSEKRDRLLQTLAREA
jgi:hypothetical protein